MIQLLINGNLTDCEIIATPKGVYTEQDGIYDFPVCVAVGNVDKPYDKNGYMVSCPLLPLNEDGVQPVVSAPIFTSLKLDSFIRILASYPDSVPVVKDPFQTKDDGVKYRCEEIILQNAEKLDCTVQKILEEMYDHGVVNSPRTVEFIKNKEYRNIETIIKAWKLQ